jgi:hypothetical protein
MAVAPLARSQASRAVRRSPGQDRAGRVLVGRRQGDGVDPGARQVVDPDAGVVDGDRHDVEPGARRDAALLGAAGVLERDAPDAPGGEGAAHDPLALRVAGRDHDLRGVRDDAAHAAR